MRNTGVLKVIDDLGRIVLPKEIRRSLGLDIRSRVVLYVDGNNLVISKAEDSCIFCGSEEELTEFKDKCICKKCLDSLK